MNKKGFAPLVILALAFLVGAVLISSGYLDIGAGIGGSTEQVWKARLGRLECLKDESPEIITTTLSQQNLFKCGDKYTVDDCSFSVKNTKTGIIPQGSQATVYECDFNGQNCQPSTNYLLFNGNTKDLPVLANGKSYKIIKAGGTSPESYTQITQKFNPYRLYTFESGGKFISSSSDCCLANQDELQKNNFKFGEWSCLDKKGANKNKNYFVDWIQTEGKIYSYQGKEVICSNNALYNLDRQKLADSSTRNVMGEQIKSIECCPYQSNKCSSSTFTFLKEADKEKDRECTYSYECENAGNPWLSTSTKGKIQKCVSETCVESEISIECNSDARCRELKGDGYGCDLSNDNFGKCIKIGQIAQARCGDLICQTGETKDNCPSDCALSCPENWKVVTIEKKINCAIGFPLYFGCDKQVETKCSDGGIDYMKYLIWVIVIIFVIILFKYLRPVLKSIPGIGKVIP